MQPGHGLEQPLGAACQTPRACHPAHLRFTTPGALAARSSLRLRVLDHLQPDAVSLSLLRVLFGVALIHLERVMNLGENRIGMRIPRSAWFLRDLRFPHSYAVSNRVHNTL